MRSVSSVDIIDEIYGELLLGLTTNRSSYIFGNQVTVKELLSPCECELMNRIVDVGKEYWQVKQFVDEKVNIELREGSVGQYMVCCVEHLDQTLEPYRAEIVGLQSEVPCLSHLYSRVYPYSEVMQGLSLMVQELNICDRRGTDILETLDKHLNTSTGAFHVAAKFIHQGVCQLLFNQLQSWLLYGEIVDTKKNFFIQKTSDSKNPFEDFSLCYALVPSFIRPLVAENILDFGQTVLYLRSRPESLPAERIIIDSSGIIGEKAEEIKKILGESKTETWNNWRGLERAVETVGGVVTSQLHSLALEGAGLISQLHMVKDLYLMGRGELFHEFVTHTDDTTAKGPSSLLDLNLVLRACARKVLIREEVLLPFSLELSSHKSGSIHTIHYSVPWPLELLFTPEVIENYNHIFRFLLRLKRNQVKMVAAWLRDKSKRKIVSCVKRRQLQHNLWFLVNNLQYYLQVDVLDSQFMSLETSIVASQNFEQIRKAHSHFLSNLKDHSFLDSPQDSNGIVNPVQQRLASILKLCEEFCAETEQSDDEEMSPEIVESLSTKFDVCFHQLLSLLAALKKQAGNPRSQHLGQLLLRLDFNHFLSAQSSLVNIE